MNRFLKLMLGLIILMGGSIGFAQAKPINEMTAADYVTISDDIQIVIARRVFCSRLDLKIRDGYKLYLGRLSLNQYYALKGNIVSRTARNVSQNWNNPGRLISGTVVIGEAEKEALVTKTLAENPDLIASMGKLIADFELACTDVNPCQESILGCGGEAAEFMKFRNLEAPQNVYSEVQTNN